MAGPEARASIAPTQVMEAFSAAMPNAPISMDITPVPLYSKPTLSTETVFPVQNEANSTPLLKIPGPEIRALHTDQSLLPLAAHETQHAYVMYMLGYGSQMEYITLEPHGDTIAEVSVSGHIPLYDFATIAAASSSGMFNFTPDGTAMDEHQIEIRGQSLFHHLSRAEDKLKTDPPEVMQKLFEMVAYFRTVDGSQFPVLLEQARDEYEMELKNEKHKIQERFITQPKPRNLLGEHTKFIHISDDHYIGQWIKDGEIIAEVDVIKCPNCGMFHGGECPFEKTKRNNIPASPDYSSNTQNQPVSEPTWSAKIDDQPIAVPNWPRNNSNEMIEASNWPVKRASGTEVRSSFRMFKVP